LNILKKLVLFFTLLYFSFSNLAQNDSLPYTLFKEKILFYQDLGFNTTPIVISGEFKNNLKSITYINNPRLILSLGGTYKWISGRLSVAIFGNMLSLKEYGKTSQFNLGFNFSVKKNYFEVDLNFAAGYTLLNSNKWSNSNHQILPDMNTIDLGLRTWYFHNKFMKMQLLKGRIGHYNKEIMSFYAKSAFNIFNLNNLTNTIIPTQLTDSLNTKTLSNNFSSVELSLIPGFAYVNRKNNWQYSILIGIGGALQLKDYSTTEINRSFIGLAPRFDFRINGGYNVPRFFSFLSLEYDNKSVTFNELSYYQNYISVNLTVGVRLKTLKDWRISKIKST
jgi:hypothetical protein